MDFNLQSWCCN